MENNKLKGVHPNLAETNLAAMDPDYVNITPESKKILWDAVKPLPVECGEVIIFSTSEAKGNEVSYFKKLWDEAGVMPISAEYTHYWDVIRKPASQEEFFAEVEKAAEYFKVENIVEPSEDGKKRIEDLKNLKYGDKLDRTQPHWAFLNKQE